LNSGGKKKKEGKKKGKGYSPKDGGLSSWPTANCVKSGNNHRKRDRKDEPEAAIPQKKILFYYNSAEI